MRFAFRTGIIAVRPQATKNRREAAGSLSGHRTLPDFAECLDALGAQRGFDGSAVLQHRNPLQVGMERPVGGPLGM